MICLAKVSFVSENPGRVSPLSGIIYRLTQRKPPPLILLEMIYFSVVALVTLYILFLLLNYELLSDAHVKNIAIIVPLEAT